MKLDDLGNKIVADIDAVIEKYKNEWMMDIRYEIDINFFPFRNEYMS